MKGIARTISIAAGLALLTAGQAHAQLATGSITGLVRDTSGAVLPGVTLSLMGDRLIGGAQVRNSTPTGTYGFERLPPGLYTLTAQLTGFRPVERRDLRVDAGFTATVNLQLAVGSLSEAVEVTGGSPTVDTRSSLQQIVMDQQILQNVPTGRDPWALAKIIPGVQVSTYDVGGTQGMQQSSMRAHGANESNVVYAVDGLDTNWPGGGGGAVAMYYDQGMFEQINFQTSALPAEVEIGGIYINMVTKEGGNKTRGSAQAFYASDGLQGDNSNTPELRRFAFPGGNPVDRSYDLNASLGGPVLKDRLWWFGGYRNWSVNKLALGAINPDGSRPVDDNRIVNYSGKLTWQVSKAHKLTGLYNRNVKDRFHRRDVPPAYVEDRATQRQETIHRQLAVNYSWVLGQRAVFESGFSDRDGQGEFSYQPGVQETDIRIEDPVRSTASVAGPNFQLRPNGRRQLNSSVSFATGAHSLKLGVQWARQSFETEDRVNGDLYIILNDGVPNSVRIFNTPTRALSFTEQVGFFAQDAWRIKDVTLNLGARFDHVRGYWPVHDVPAGRFIGARHLDAADAVKQNVGVWRAGLSYDVGGKGKTAVKASFSRYGEQVGIDRVTNIHPLVSSSGTRAWTDRNGDRIPQDSELGAFSGFADVNRRYADSNGPDWPYADEVTAGVEHQLGRDVRVGLMYYHRANRRQVGTRNVAVPASAYSPQSLAAPGSPTGPGGTATFFNLSPAFFGRQDNVLDNDALLDNDYNGVEVTLAKRFAGRWQMLAGFTLSKGEGGINTGDLNDQNNLVNQQGIVGRDSLYSLKLAGSYRGPADLMLSGSLLLNDGYPYQSAYSVTRSVFPTLTRASQSIRLSRSGEERLPDVALVDLRLSRPFKLGGTRLLEPSLEVFNLTNASTIVGLASVVGSRYLAPTEILSPRIVRLGLRFDF